MSHATQTNGSYHTDKEDMCPICIHTNHRRQQHAAAQCNTLYYAATHSTTLQYTTPHCSALQHTATYCHNHNTLTLTYPVTIAGATSGRETQRPSCACRSLCPCLFSSIHVWCACACMFIHTYTQMSACINIDTHSCNSVPKCVTHDTLQHAATHCNTF